MQWWLSYLDFTYLKVKGRKKITLDIIDEGYAWQCK